MLVYGQSDVLASFSVSILVSKKECFHSQIIPIIDIPGFGDRAAEKVCSDLKIQSQNDTKKLEEAKKQVYLKGFTDGVMVVGKYTGEKVQAVNESQKHYLSSC